MEFEEENIVHNVSNTKDRVGPHFQTSKFGGVF